jgi:hypothetical protein
VIAFAKNLVRFVPLAQFSRVLSLFCQQQPSESSKRVWPIYVGATVAVGALYSVFLFLFGSRGSRIRGESPPIDRYIPHISLLAEHTLQVFSARIGFCDLSPTLFQAR